MEAHAAGYGGAEKSECSWETGLIGCGNWPPRHFPEAIRVLDWYHLSEKVHEAANVVFGEGTEESKAWAKSRLDELWEG